MVFSGQLSGELFHVAMDSKAGNFVGKTAIIDTRTSMTPGGPLPNIGLDGLLRSTFRRVSDVTVDSKAGDFVGKTAIIDTGASIIPGGLSPDTGLDGFAPRLPEEFSEIYFPMDVDSICSSPSRGVFGNTFSNGCGLDLLLAFQRSSRKSIFRWMWKNPSTSKDGGVLQRRRTGEGPPTPEAYDFTT